jgi:hypothetical protein
MCGLIWKAKLMSTVQSGMKLGLHPRPPGFRPPSGLHDEEPLAHVIGGEPSGHGFIALLAAFRASGGTAPATIVAPLLEDRHAGGVPGLAELVYREQVFGFAWRASLWIPMFQFRAGDLSVQTGPQQVRAALPWTANGWHVAAWFASPNACLQGARPVDLIEEDLSTVLGAARSWRPPPGWAHQQVLP